MQYEFNIKLNQDDLDKVLAALEKMPMGEVLQVTKKIANQVSDQSADAAEFEFDMEEAAMKWKPTPRSELTLQEALQKLKEDMDKHIDAQVEAERNVQKPKNPKKHWTQTPAGKAKLAARKKRGAK